MINQYMNVLECARWQLVNASKCITMGEGCYCTQGVRESLPLRSGHSNRFVGESREQVMWVSKGRDFQRKQIGSRRVLKWECAWYAGEMAKRPVREGQERERRWDPEDVWGVVWGSNRGPC